MSACCYTHPARAKHKGGLPHDIRSFLAPWQVEQIPGRYEVLDATGQALAYVSARETKA